MSSYVIGIDVGGTNTDAVILKLPEKTLVSAVKTFTTRDIQSGILNSLEQVLQKAQTKVKAEDIVAVTLGTTAFINAVLQCSDELSKVSVIRLCGPSTHALKPFVDWPHNLEQQIKQSVHMAQGGYEFNAVEISPFCPSEIEKIAKELLQKAQASNESRVNIVISGVFAPIKTEQEDQAAEIVSRIFRNSKIDVSITKSNNLSHLGLLERESASILNASLQVLAEKTINGFKAALLNAKMPNIPLFLTQNDGTLITADFAMEYPVFTFSSGPTNSLRGASELSKLLDGIVLDIGGTSTDVAVLQKGFPRPSAAYVKVGGVRTNFRMPDTVSIALGGGSLVKFKNGACHIGPQSVGYKLKEAAMCFGGSVLTTTDIAIAKGLFHIDGADKSKVKCSEQELDLAMARIQTMIEDAIDLMKTTPEDTPLIVVGGGAVLLPEHVKLKGISNVIKPEHFGNANAVGAAIAQVSANIDRIVHIDENNRESVLEKVKEEASQAAIAAGAIADSIEVNFELIPLSYLPGGATRAILKAIGTLDVKSLKLDQSSSVQIKEHLLPKDDQPFVEIVRDEMKEEDMKWVLPEKHIIQVNNGRKEWILTEADIECITIGNGILGTGGGASPYTAGIICKQFIREGKRIRVIAPEEVKEDELSVPIGFLGAPLIAIEKVTTGNEMVNAVQTLKQNFNEKINNLVLVEIGGMNGLTPLYTGALLDMPVVDCDGMGRAYPELQMTSFSIYGKPYTPTACSDEKGNNLIYFNVEHNSPKKLEDQLRKIAVGFGCFVAVATNPLTKKEVDKIAIPHSLSRAWRLGRAIMEARIKHINPLKAIEEKENGRLIFVGKIVDVIRTTERGFNFGRIKINGFDQFNDSTLLIKFQNENLIAYKQAVDSDEKQVIAIVPDLICIVDSERYQPILTEDLKYGLRVAVLLLPSVPMMQTAEALAVIGPQVFGYSDVTYNPIGGYKHQNSEVLQPSI